MNKIYRRIRKIMEEILILMDLTTPKSSLWISSVKESSPTFSKDSHIGA